MILLFAVLLSLLSSFFKKNVVVQKKAPLSLLCEAEPCCFLLLLSLFLHTAFRFTVCCKVKIIAVKVSVQHVHCLVVFVNRLQKYHFFLNTANKS